MESYLKGLNKEQLEAVRHEAGPCMVLAGPGTGKTTVITSRIANLIKRKTVLPENILVVTFSRAAANEMKERYAKLSAAQSTSGVCFGTFHSVFYKLLRQYRGYKLEDLLDENQKFNVIRNIVRRLGIGLSEEEDQIRDIISDMEFVISTMADAASCRLSSCDSRQLVRIIEEYDEFKQQSGKYDYDDIIYDCFYLMRKSPGILAEIRDKFKYILVDEFQVYPAAIWI
jgi:DNA helicase-2/ATP-dependent DNA helicase PcrA